MCVTRLRQRLEGQLWMLGPRTPQKYRELFQRVTRSASWVTSEDVPEFKGLTETIDGLVMHRFHAEALRISKSTVFVPLSVPFSRCRAAVRSAYTTNIIDVKRLANGVCGRAKTKHQMHSIETMLEGIACAGSRGIHRSEIAAEYENAHIDLHTLVATQKVFATHERVWSRHCAPRPPDNEPERFRSHFKLLLEGGV